MCRGKHGLKCRFFGCFVLGAAVIILFYYLIIYKVSDSITCAFVTQVNLQEAGIAIKDLTQCSDNFANYEFKKRDDFVVLYNYVTSTRRFKCEDSVTYVTHGDYTFFNHLFHIVDRWQGPVSIAIHAPGDDLLPTLNSIKYLRSCVTGIKEYVTFHIYFNESYLLEEIPSHQTMQESSYNCSLRAPYENVIRKDMFVSRNEILYPINVGRNIAKSMAETHFVLVSDIELYPSEALIPNFLMMVASCKSSIEAKYGHHVYALQVFEVDSNAEVPNNKSVLQNMLTKKLAIPFHHSICSECHSVPKYYSWIRSHKYEGMGIFTAAKRVGKYYHWEPFYLGTKEDPDFDERLSWNGMSDKIVQAYTMCLMDYSFLILDNAFLVHSPGIKKSNPLAKQKREKYVNATKDLLDTVIVPELKNKFKNAKGCEL